MKKINWHDIKTYGFWLIVGVIGALQALQGSGVGDFTTVISLLGMSEHYLSGK